MTDHPDLQLLKRSADLIRARANAANTDEARRPYSDSRCDPVPETQWGGLVDNYLGGVIGEHCAAWTPTVALAVADWLDRAADPYWCGGHEPWLAIARAYLGASVVAQ